MASRAHNENQANFFFGVFPTICDVRSLVVQKPFLTKTDTSIIVARFLGFLYKQVFWGRGTELVK